MKRRMVQRCSCGKVIARFPLKGQQDKTLAQNIKEGTINWANLFKMDLMSFVFFIFILLLAFQYKTDIAKCNDVIEDPVTWCEKSNACEAVSARYYKKMFNQTDIRLYDYDPTLLDFFAMNETE